MLLLTLVLLLAGAGTGDWSRFRGPNGTGVQETGRLPAELSATRNVAWKTALPPGYSSPVVSGDRIFLTAFEGEKLLTIALDRASGKERWRRESPRDRREKLDSRNGPASPTPVADGKNVYVFFPDYGLLSYTFAGEERWRTPLGPFNNVYGMAASPVLAGDLLILVCDQNRGSFAAGFRQSDGREVWRTPRPDALSGHSTPVVYDPAGGPLQVVAPGSFRMDNYSVATGGIVSWVNGLPGEMKSGPVLAGDIIYVNGFSTPDNDPGQQVFVPPFAEVLARHDADKNGRLALAEAPDERTRRYFAFIDLDEDGAADAAEWRIWINGSASENGLLAFRAGGRGDLSGKSLLWRYTRSVPQLPTTLVYRGRLHMINDGGILTTFDAATGAVKKQARLRGAVDHYYASPVAGDGKVYIVSQSGVVVVLDALRDQEVLFTGEMQDEVYATPAIAFGHVFIRTRGALYSFGSGQEDAALVKARTLLDRVGLIDGHNDLPWTLRETFGSDLSRLDLRKRGATVDTDIPRLREGRVSGQFWSVFIPSGMPNPARTQLEQIELARRMIAAYPDTFLLATSAADVERARQQGKIASFLGMENGQALENSLGALRAFYALGVRYMTLTHGKNNDWADSATDTAAHGGLTAFGREVVREMNRLGMLVDISHVSPDVMRQVLDLSEAPVVFSHSSARALVGHPRNVPDDVLARMTRNGGVVMVTFIPAFVSAETAVWGKGLETSIFNAKTNAEMERLEKEYAALHGPAPTATLAQVADHIEHVARIAGRDHVGIGSDFYGSTDQPSGLADVSRFPDLFAELIRRGWSDPDLEKLAAGNVLRTLRNAEVAARRLAASRGRRPPSKSWTVGLESGRRARTTLPGMTDQSLLSLGRGSNGMGGGAGCSEHGRAWPHR